MPVVHPDTRGSIKLEDASVLQHWHHDGEQHILRLDAPQCAKHAVAGQFVHLQCDPALPLRRPLSIMRTNAAENWIDLLYKDVGHGTHLLAGRQPGDVISILGPIGNRFELSSERSIRVLIGGGVGIPPMIFLADTIASQYPHDLTTTLVIMGSEVPFPFELQKSGINIDGIDKAIDSSLTLLEERGIASRLASLQDYNGCYRGYAPDLASHYLSSLDAGQLAQVEIYTCGPLPMLAATKRLANEFNVSCQVSLEETMACGVGGCAGCVVEVNLPQGTAMKRVCVDGPVFDARHISL
jgi:dihydroorotate dehydrogenase electron transfer subunit